MPSPSEKAAASSLATLDSAEASRKAVESFSCRPDSVPSLGPPNAATTSHPTTSRAAATRTHVGVRVAGLDGLNLRMGPLSGMAR